MLIRSSWMLSFQLQSVSRVRHRLLSLLLSFHRVCTQERYCENRVCIREIEEQLPQSRREREREIVRDKRLSRRERLIGVAIGSKGLRPSILISIIVGPRWNPLSNLSLFLPPSTSTRTPAGHRNYASFHRCYSSLIQIMLRSITEREREGEKVRFIRNSGLEEEVTGSMRVIFSRKRFRAYARRAEEISWVAVI